LLNRSYSSGLKCYVPDVLVIVTVLFQLAHIALGIRIVICSIFRNADFLGGPTIIPSRLYLWTSRFGQSSLSRLGWQHLRNSLTAGVKRRAVRSGIIRLIVLVNILFILLLLFKSISFLALNFTLTD